VTVVVGTAGHIDHGKTTLLRALTGMDADRLPDEKRRGLTIDIGYARAAPDDGDVIDFVDVPGHDKLVGNMLVGAGEIDACLLVVAADDGPKAQTLEHLALLDALRIDVGVIALTKTDRVPPERVDAVRDELAMLLAETTLADAPIVPVSAQTGEGLVALKVALATLRDTLAGSETRRSAGSRLAIDRVFSIKGFGAVVTGSARGAPLVNGQRLGVMPGDGAARIRGIQVHDQDVGLGPTGGRVALNLSGIDHTDLRRGHVLVDADTELVASRRLLVALDRPVELTTEGARPAWPPRDGAGARVHLATDQCAASLGRGGRDNVVLGAGSAIAMLRLEREVAVAGGDRFVLRQPHPAGLLAGGVVLDPNPARGASRKRQTPLRLQHLDTAVRAGEPSAIEAALTDLHGIRRQGEGVAIAEDVRASLGTDAIDAVTAAYATIKDRAGLALAELRRVLASASRRHAGASADSDEVAADDVIGQLIDEGVIERDGDLVRLRGHAPAGVDPIATAAAERLVSLLDVLAPPALSAATTTSGCEASAVRELEREGRIVIVDDDLAWSRDAYDALASTALTLAREAPMTPAALRDATGTSRKYVMALLEDLARRGVLARTPTGHVPGPRA
jgi:selenocysteine-specific elongation factor